MRKRLNRFWVFLLGERLALRLRLYVPEHISPDNKIVYSYIYGVDDQDEDGNEGSHG